MYILTSYVLDNCKLYQILLKKYGKINIRKICRKI